jgi:hypothetical protein
VSFLYLVFCLFFVVSHSKNDLLLLLFFNFNAKSEVSFHELIRNV